MESVVRDAQNLYYDALEKSGSLGKSTPFIKFMLEAILLTCKGTLVESDNVPLKRLDQIVEYMRENRNVNIE